ncbi:MAG: hypothetical protein IT518_14725 [Burkholderiales bacterium]|nr:hypothetical protein [Burkholderiales bacterium]
MDLLSTVARLKTIAAFKQNVAGAAAYAQAITGGFRVVPAAFVIPLAETTLANPFGNQVVQQQFTARLGVVIAVQNKRDPLGGQATADRDALREAVFAKLLGWPPAPGFGGFEWAGGALLDLTDQVLFWQDDFTSDGVRRSV